MIFLNNLYTISDCQRQDVAVQYLIGLNADHVIYQAHFPGMPVTPGVCLLQIARELLEDHCQMSLDIHHIKNIKFLSVVSPVELPQVRFQLNPTVTDENNVDCRVTVTSPDGDTLAKMSFKSKRIDR